MRALNTTGKAKPIPTWGARDTPSVEDAAEEAPAEEELPSWGYSVPPC